MEPWLAALEQSQVASFFRSSRVGYAFLNATHIAGIATLVGAILPLDLRMLGLWSGVDRRQLARVLVPMAATGLTIAVASGLVLFSVRAREYSGLFVFQMKLALICIGVAWAIATHAIYGLRLDRRAGANLAIVGTVSISIWITVLICGRFIAFSD